MRPGRVAAEVKRRPAAVELMTHPGVGPVMTALAMVLTLGPAERFSSARQVASYFGLIPREHSRGGRQWLGHISKQGSPFLRFLRVKAGQSAARYDAVLADSIAGWRCLSIADWRKCRRPQAGREVAADVAPGLELRATVQGRGQASPSHSVVVTRKPTA